MVLLFLLWYLADDQWTVFVLQNLIIVLEDFCSIFNQQIVYSLFFFLLHLIGRRLTAILLDG